MRRSVSDLISNLDTQSRFPVLRICLPPIISPILPFAGGLFARSIVDSVSKESCTNVQSNRRRRRLLRRRRPHAARTASTASQTSAAWLARRAPGPQALPSPTGLCAGAPAGRPPDGVRATQLLGTRAGGLPCDAEAGPCEACKRRSSCALATYVHLVLRAGVPATPPAFGEDGERAAR